MLRRFGIAAVCSAAALCLLTTSVMAQPFTKDEQKCESNAGKTLAKFTGSYSKCVQKCLGTARKTSGPYTGCFPPYSDPTTMACLIDPAKGAAIKARAGIVKKCNVAGKDSCPECYDPANCTTGAPFVAAVSGQIDPFVILIYCLEASAATPTKEQGKCEDGVSKALVKFVGAKTKCYDKCNANAFKGLFPAANCVPPATDPATVTCITTAEGKASAAIDKVCANVPSATPGCYGTGLDQGSEWTALTEGAVDATNPTVACGSPSGAFLN